MEVVRLNDGTVRWWQGQMMVRLYSGGEVLSGIVRWGGAIECWYGTVVRYSGAVSRVCCGMRCWCGTVMLRCVGKARS